VRFIQPRSWGSTVQDAIFSSSGWTQYIAVSTGQ